MRESWRWFGPNDQVKLHEVAQAGASGIVTALHHVPPGAVWSLSEIRARQELIQQVAEELETPLEWVVAESLPVTEDIKRQSGDWRSHVEAYKTSLNNLAKAGVETICYNFMPVLDWTRTELAHRLPNRGTCMRFDLIDFVMFDVFVLGRKGAQEDFPQEIVEEARLRNMDSSDARKQQILANVVCGLPGGAEAMTVDQVTEHLDQFKGIDHDRLSRNQSDFLEMVAPHAQDLGLRLCCHPDDPPFPLLGLPRIMSGEADYRRMTEAVDIPANGITLCSGSLGARADNDLPGMVRRLGPRVHFLHLRNVVLEHDQTFGSFHESEHLEGAVDMPALVQAVLEEEKRRRSEGRGDVSIPFRPDHGQDILDDLERRAQPGYPAIGRLKGLAELRGLIAGLRHGGNL